MNTTINGEAQKLNETLQSVHPASFAVLSAEGQGSFFPSKGILAQTAAAKGKEYNATIGVAYEEDGSFMGLSCVSGTHNINPQEVLGYAPAPGVTALRKKWQDMILAKNPSLKTLSLPVVTSGLTHGLSIAARLFLNGGEELILPDYFWGNYKLIFAGFCSDTGPKMNTFPTFADGKFNVAGLKEKLMSEGEKKVVLVNFPNNPTGYTPTNEEVTEILAVFTEAAEAGKKIVALCDDAYFGLVYEEGVYEESIFVPLSTAHENILAVKIDGATKEDYVWGFRLGFMSYGSKGLSEEGYAVLEEKTTGIIRSRLSSCSHLIQEMMLKAFDSEQYTAEKKEKNEILNKRYHKVREVLDAHPEYSKHFEALPYNSGYFMCVAIKNLEPEDLRQHLLDKYSTGLIAVKHMVRIAYASLPLHQIEGLFANIYNACEDLTA